MQIAWHGRDGKHGKDKSILTIGIKPEIENQLGKNLTLKAGINDGIKEEDWKEALQIETVRWYLSQGCLEVVHAETLADFPEYTAASMAKETIDMNLLAKWRKAELISDHPRASVIAAIDKQLTAMTTLPPEVVKAREEARKQAEAKQGSLISFNAQES